MKSVEYLICLQHFSTFEGWIKVQSDIDQSTTVLHAMYIYKVLAWWSLKEKKQKMATAEMDTRK